MNYLNHIFKAFFVFIISFSLLAQPQIGDVVEMKTTLNLRNFNGTKFGQSPIAGTIQKDQKRKIHEIREWSNGKTKTYILTLVDKDNRIIGSVMYDPNQTKDPYMVLIPKNNISKPVNSKFANSLQIQKSVPIENADGILALKDITVYQQMSDESFSTKTLSKNSLGKISNSYNLYPQNPDALWMGITLEDGEKYLINRDQFPKVQRDLFSKLVENLKKSSSGPNPPPYNTCQAQQSDVGQKTKNKSLNISSSGLSLIRMTEGCFTSPYICPAGHKTIGCGHLCDPPSSCPSSITESEIQSLLKKDIIKFENIVKKEFPSANFTQGQFDALVSISFNLGNIFSPRSDCTFCRLIDKYMSNGKSPTLDQLQEISGQMSRFQKANGISVAGLQRRRTIEANLMIYGNLPKGLENKTGYPNETDTILKPIYNQIQSTLDKKLRTDYHAR